MKPSVHKCLECGNCYQTASGLSRHKDHEKEEGTYKYSCSHCKTNRKDNYDRHIESCAEKQQKGNKHFNDIPKMKSALS